MEMVSAQEGVQGQQWQEQELTQGWGPKWVEQEWGGKTKMRTA